VEPCQPGQRRMRAGWLSLVVVIGAVAVVAIWGALRAIEERRCRTSLEQAKRGVSEGRYGRAQARVSQLVVRRPGWGGGWCNVGVCEQERRQVQAAWGAFAKVPSGSPWAGWSEVRRSRIALDRGQFSASEALLRSAAARPGSHRAEARWGLVLVLRMQGRF